MGLLFQTNVDFQATFPWMKNGCAFMSFYAGAQDVYSKIVIPGAEYYYARTAEGFKGVDSLTGEAQWLTLPYVFGLENKIYYDDHHRGLQEIPPDNLAFALAEYKAKSGAQHFTYVKLWVFNGKVFPVCLFDPMGRKTPVGGPDYKLTSYRWYLKK